MTGPAALLSTKLDAQPRLGRPVHRDRLSMRLDRAGDARLILVAAPAGFGKSTLLADWIAGGRSRSAWLSLDARDNDVVRFDRYLAAAAARLAGGDPEITNRDPARPFDAELALARVLASVASAMGDAPAGGVVLVLDDYHHISEPAVHALVVSLVERLPPRARLAIATRADPPLPLARLRARGELLELRAADLRFTPQEAGALLRSASIDLAPADVAAITDRTEGWAAVLRLAAVALRDRPDPELRVRRFGATHRFVLDYVVEEVLAGLTPETHAFLLRTAILERLSGPLCDAVTGRTDGQQALEALEQANLLIVPLDDERGWYRYHALFAEVLKARLTIDRADEVAALHGRASAWFEAAGDDDLAIAHARLAGDDTRLAGLVASASGRHINAGELGTVRGWLDAMPAELVRGHAQLSASYAWCLLLAGETAGVAARLEDADRALAAGPDGGPARSSGIPAQVALLRSQLAGMEGDVDGAVAQARLARELVPPGLPPVATAALRGTASALLGLALLRAGDPRAAADAYEAALPDLRAGGNRLAVARTIADLARLAIADGDPLGAVRRCQAEFEHGGDGATGPAAAAIWAAMARARAELGQADLAVAAARRALELATRAGDAPSARSAQATIERIGAHPDRGAHAGDGRTAVRSAPDAPVEALTCRELEVLRLVAIGRSNRQVAAELFVTVGTVKSHLHTISGKLGAANRVEAVARGRSLGLFD